MPHQLYVIGSGSISSLGAHRTAVVKSYEAGEPHSLIRPRSVRDVVMPTAPLSPCAEEILAQRCRSVPFLAARDRVVQLAACAALDALDEARSNGFLAEHCRVAVVCGSARGATASLEDEHARCLASEGVSVVTSPSTTAGVIASSVAQVCNLSGIAVDTSMTCTSGLHALLVARALIIARDVDAAVVVGSEAALTPFTLEQIAALRISPRADPLDLCPCRPFSAETSPRSRMVLGEGAAAIVVVGESLRKAVCGEHYSIEAIGFAAESPPSLTGIGSEGCNFQEAMRRALVAAGCEPNDIDAVICHAPGTVKGDQAEMHALRDLFGDHLPPLYSTKWLTGHTYGASGLLSMELAQLMMQGTTPAAPRYLSYGLQPARTAKKPRTLVINAAGFGGNALSVLIKGRT